MSSWAGDFGAFYRLDVKTSLKSREFFTPRRTGLEFVGPPTPSPEPRLSGLMYISTLGKIIEAMGGQLDIRAVLPNGVVRINQFEEVRKPARTHPAAGR
jgi:hypothetical protein